MRFNILIFWVLFGRVALMAQNADQAIENMIERLVEDTEDEIDIQELTDQLTYYLSHPLHLNKVSYSDLVNSFLFSPLQAQNIIQHRLKYGDFLKMEELQVLQAFSLEQIRLILPFITLGYVENDKLTWKGVWTRNKQELMSLSQINTPIARGYTITDPNRSQYLGSPLYNNLRYRFDYKNQIKMGFVAEKDAGEPFGRLGNERGYDFYSFHLGMQNVGRINSLQVGDYHVAFGQGLSLFTNISFGKSSVTQNLKRNLHGFQSSRSLRENAAMRGLAADIQIFKHVSVGAFVSSKKIDASGLSTLDTFMNEEEFISSIQEEGGLHRTQTELNNKNRLLDQQIGGHMTYTKNALRVGAVSTFRRFGATVNPRENLYNQYAFRGNQYHKTGLFYDYSILNFNFFGEVSHSDFQNQVAYVSGALIGLGRYASATVLHRNYPRAFISLQTAGLGESGNTQNERGTLLGLEISPLKKIKISGFFDVFQHDWLRFRMYTPSQGTDLWVDVFYKPNRQWNINYRFRQKYKLRNLTANNTFQLEETELIRHRLHLTYQVNKSLRLATRMEVSKFTFTDEPTFGSLIFQDIRYKPFGKKWEFTMRAAHVSMENFDNRIFAFENVPLYQYPLFAYSFSGFRTYALVRYRPHKKLDIWFRYALSRRDYPIDQLQPNPRFGSGLEEIDGFNRNTFTLQLRYTIK